MERRKNSVALSIEIFLVTCKHNIKLSEHFQWGQALHSNSYAHGLVVHSSRQSYKRRIQCLLILT